MTGTQLLSRLVGPDVAKELTFTARVSRVGGGRADSRPGSPTSRAAAVALATEIAGRNPDAVRGAKALFNRLANAEAAEQFAEERRVIGSLIGSPNQIEAVTANFEQRAAVYVDP